MKKLLAAILLFTFPALADFQVPSLKNPVNDYANVLTSSGKEKIAREVVRLKQETGAQVGVLIVESLDGDSIEEASMKAAKQWKLGSKNRDDGVLLLIATKDRKFRLEVGYGLESIITDYYAKQITASMRAPLKAQNYDGAVLAGIQGVSSRIKAHASEITTKTIGGTEEGSGFGIFLLVLAGIAGLFGFGVYRSSEKARKEREKEARRLAKQPLTSDEKALAALMAADLAKQAKKNPATPKKETTSRRRSDDDDDSFVTGAVVGSILSSSSSDSGFSSSSSSDSGFSSSSSDFGGGGGDFGGGGSSDSF